MTWQRGARIVLAAVGLGCAVALWALRREPPAEPPAITLKDPDRAAAAQGGAATRNLFEGSSTRARWSVETWVSYTNPDRIVGSKNHMIFEEEGLEIWSDEAEVRGTAAEAAPSEVRFAGQVRITTRDGLELTTPTATYNGTTEVIVMPQAVTFSKGRMSGSGANGTYDRKQELFQLNEQATIVVVPDAEGHGGLQTSARRLTAARLEKFTRLDENATIVTQTESLKGDTATLYFTDDEQHLTLVDLQGHASVDPVTPEGSTRPVMRADHIALAFHPTGNVLSRSTLTGHASATLAGGRTVTAPWLDIVLGTDGATVIGIDAKPSVVVALPAAGATPERRIEAATLTARGADGRGLRSARFDAASEGRVRFTERSTRPGAAGPTTALSRVLVLVLDGSLDAMTEAEFRGNVDFRSGTSKATGEWGQYHATAGTLQLTQQAGNATPPIVEQKDLWVSAPAITLGVHTQDLDAKGGVRTRLRPSTTGERRPPSLFEPGRDVIGTAESLAYTGGTGIARYTGSAKTPAELRQDDGAMVAGEVIDVDDDKGTLAATRSVRTRFPASEAAADGRPPDRAPVMSVATSEAFTYADSTRRAVHRGAPATLTSEGRVVEANEIEMFMARESRALDRLVASGHVFATLDRDHEAKGDRLEFTSATRMYVLTGTPVEMRAPSEDGQGCFKTVGVLAHFNRETRLVAWPALPDGRQQGVETVAWPCGKSIR